METSLGRGYSINEDFGMTDFYSPPSSVIDEIDEHEDDVLYPEDGEQDESSLTVSTTDTALPESLLEDINKLTLITERSHTKSTPLKLLPTGSTPPPTPLVLCRPFLPSNLTTTTTTPSAMTSMTSTPSSSSSSSASTVSTMRITQPDSTSLNVNNLLPISSIRNNNNASPKIWHMAGSTADVRNSTNLSFSSSSNNLLKTNTSTSNLNHLTTTNMDFYFTGNHSLADSQPRSSSVLDSSSSMISSSTLPNSRPTSLSTANQEMHNEYSRLYSYMSPVEELTPTMRTGANTWSTSDDSVSNLPVQSRFNNNPFSTQMNLNSNWTSRTNTLVPNISNPISPMSSFQHQPTSPASSMMNPFQNQNSVFLSEMSAMLRQNQQQHQSSMLAFNNNITLSTTAQQILAANMHGGNNNNNRPLRSEKIDIEIIKHLIREAKWKRHCGLKKEVCVFCRNNGENELIYSSHSLKDSLGNVTCPILRAYQCPICGATGAQAHTIKYCQATGDDNNQHIPTPYEKMIRTQCIQNLALDESSSSTMPAIFDPLAVSPSSLYTNGWSNSYL